MTPRQRWFALLENRRPDRIPTDYQATPEVTARLLVDLGCGDEIALWRRLHVDKRLIIEPRWGRPHSSTDPQADLWGIRYRKVDYGGGTYDEPCSHPLAGVENVDEVHAYPWPSADDFDYSPIAEAVRAADGYWPIHAGCYEPLLLYGYLRGLELAFEDLALRPELAEAILGHLFAFHHEHHRRVFEAGRGRIDLTWVAEDLGSQHGPLVSLAMYRRFLLENQIRMADLARAYGVHVMYHTDGAARMFLPDLIERVGIEILNPIQWCAAGMDREALVRDFGARVIFHGSIDNQQTLAFGSADDVVEEVRQSAAIYRGSRWILCSLPQPPAGHAQRKHRGDVRDDPRPGPGLRASQAPRPRAEAGGVIPCAQPSTSYAPASAVSVGVGGVAPVQSRLTTHRSANPLPRKTAPNANA